MPWFKIDDKHHDHKKTRKALRGARGKRRDASAMGLWELAGSWSADNLQDGFVPTDELFRWDDDWEALAARLVGAGYWEPMTRDGEEGFHFINWDEHQPMKADVEAKREAARERMRALRSGSRSGSGELPANNTGSDASSSPPPSRPVPSRPQNPSSDESDATESGPMDRFDEFWDVYGKKVGRKNAETQWRSALKKKGVTADLLIKAAAEYVRRQQVDGGHPKFSKDPERWLKGEHWTDEAASNVTPLRPGDDQGRILLPPLGPKTPWGPA